MSLKSDPMSRVPMTRVPMLRGAMAGTLLMGLLALLSACGAEKTSGESGGGQKEAAAVPNILTETVVYGHEGTALEGYLAYDASRSGKRPGILVVHEWWGLSEHPRERARRLAGLGYVAFCVDMYGKGKLTEDPKQAGTWAGAFYSDPRGHGWARVQAGLSVLTSNARVDPKRIGAIGFCYGGSVVLELAWSGADVEAVVCFHGNLMSPPSGKEAPAVKAAVLVCNGADDAWVGPDKVKAFEDAVTAAGLVARVENYAGAVHAYTNEGADARGMDNVAYNAAADKASWAEMEALFAKYLKP